MSDDTESGAQADFAALLNATVPFAQQMVRQHGEFLPFGATLGPGGEVRMMGVGEEGAGAAALVEMLRRSARQAHADGTARAAAICFNARVTPPGGAETHAIQVQVEHASGEAANVYFPYRKRLLRGWLFERGDGVPCAPSLFRASDDTPADA